MKFFVVLVVAGILGYVFGQTACGESLVSRLVLSWR